MKIRAIIAEGQMMPHMYGLAYWRFDSRDRVCYPWPLNWIVRHARNTWFFLRSTTSRNYRERFELKVASRAYEKGRRELAENLKRTLLSCGKDVMATQVIAETINDVDSLLNS